MQYAEHMDRYDFPSLSFPVPLQVVGPFALRNNMSINVYGVDDDNEVIYPLRVSSTLVPDRHVDLLLFEHDGVQPYTTISDFSRLVGRQLSNHGHTVHSCSRCLHAYSSQELLDAHDPDRYHAQRTKFPKDPRCRFTNIQKQLLASFVVYADFESILRRVDDDEAMDTTQGVAAVGGDEPTADPSKSTSHAALHTRWLVVWYRTSPGLLSPTGEVCANCKRKQSSCFRSTLPLPNKCSSLPRQSCAHSTLPPTVTYATSR